MRFKSRTGADRQSSPHVPPLRFAALPRPPPHLVDALAAQVLPALAPVSPQDTMKWLRLLLVALGRRVGVAGCSVAAVAAATPEALLDACGRVLALLGPDPEAVRAAFAAEWEMLSRRAEAGPPGEVSFSAPSENSLPRSGSIASPAEHDMLRAVSVAAAEAAVSAAAPTHRTVEVDALRVAYVVPRAAPIAASVLAAAHRLARAPAPSAAEIATLPPATVAAIAAIPSALDRQLLFAEELAAKGLADPWRVLLALRACRQPGPALEAEELSAWLAGSFPLLWGGTEVRCPRGGGNNNSSNNKHNNRQQGGAGNHNNNSSNDRPMGNAAPGKPAKN